MSSDYTFHVSSRIFGRISESCRVSIWFQVVGLTTFLHAVFDEKSNRRFLGRCSISFGRKDLSDEGSLELEFFSNLMGKRFLRFGPTRHL